MKLFTMLSVFVFSFNAFAFSNVTLNKDVRLKLATDNSGVAVYWSIEGNGSKYCYVKLQTPATENKIVSAGTRLEIIQVMDQNCELDLGGRSCAVSFKAQNREKELSLGVTCIEKGLLAAPISAKKATKFSQGFMTVD